MNICINTGMSIFIMDPISHATYKGILVYMLLCCFFFFFFFTTTAFYTLVLQYSRPPYWFQNNLAAPKKIYVFHRFLYKLINLSHLFFYSVTV